MDPVPADQVTILPEWNDRLQYSGVSPITGGDEEEELAPFHQYKYFPDLNRKYVFYTGSIGARFMCQMLESCEKAQTVCRLRMNEYAEANGSTFSAVEKEGFSIYGAKPSKAEEGVTWSQKDYDFPGLQYFYLSLKSVQRYTEGFSAAQRLYNQGFFEPYIRADLAYALAVKMQKGERKMSGVICTESTRPSMRSSEKDCDGVLPCLDANILIPPPKTFVAVSLGGGPGFELLALKHLFGVLCPNTPFQAVSVDLAATWKEYVLSMGMDFATCDLSVKNLPEALQESYRASNIINEDERLHVDIHMLSYIYSMYLGEASPRSELVSLLGPVSELDTSLDTPHSHYKNLPSDFHEENESYRNRQNRLVLPFVVSRNRTSAYSNVRIPLYEGQPTGAKCLFILERGTVHSYRYIDEDPRFVVQRLVTRDGQDDRQAAVRRACMEQKVVYDQDLVSVNKDEIEKPFRLDSFVRVKVCILSKQDGAPEAVQQRENEDNKKYVYSVDFDVEFKPMQVIFPNVPYISKRRPRRNYNNNNNNRNYDNRSQNNYNRDRNYDNRDRNYDNRDRNYDNRDRNYDNRSQNNNYNRNNSSNNQPARDYETRRGDFRDHSRNASGRQ